MRYEQAPPEWAPRVRKALIRRLYESIGRGFIDEELINEVGFALLARCMSSLEVTDASRGKAKCPKCQSLARRHTYKEEKVLSCHHCGWACRWHDYQKSYQHKQLYAGGMESFFIEFVRNFRMAKSPHQRLILIDVLLHRYHYENTNRPTRPGAANLIEGKMDDIIDFLDHLTYGDNIPVDVEATREEWRKKVKQARRVWGRR